MPEAADNWQIILRPRSEDYDPTGRAAQADVHRLGLRHIEGVEAQRIYFLRGVLTDALVERIGVELLADRVTQECTCATGLTERDESVPSIEVHYLPGVMDPVAISTRDAVRDLLRSAEPDGTFSIDEIRTGRRYLVHGARDAEELDRIARRCLSNGSVERFFVQGFGRKDPLPDRFPEAPELLFELHHISLRGLDDAALLRLSRQAHLFLSLEEMRAIRDHYRALDREPTDLELETLAQTWSEHCVHKTLKSEVVYRGTGFGTDDVVEVHYDNLLASTIAKVTHDLNPDWCLSVFEDNAGIIAFDEEYGIAFKVETHNHPSAIEPYGGAATGIGGVIRDILGCGLGAKPVANTDVFCFAPPDWPDERLPRGVLHPRRVFTGVVAGVRDYGNRMGIPTVNGAIHFDERFLANPLVFCGCVGLIPRDRIAKAARPGDHIVLAGGRTGRDGIHGATFSSAELTDTHADEFAHAVQIGNPIEEKKISDAMLRARDYIGGCLFSAVTDCGAGGLSSAVGEMGSQVGAVVDLDLVPLKYAGLRYWEIWISEAQERMVFAVSPDKLDALLGIFAEEDVEATVIGSFTDDGRLHVRYRAETVGRLDMRFLHDGIPQTRRQATWTPPATPPQAPDERDPADRLLAALSSPGVASKEWVIRQYDHEVQGGSAGKPLCGPGHGPSDAAVVRPRLDSTAGIVLGCGLALGLADRDPYRMAIASVDEAFRNVICAGADPDRTAILDNFCWGGVSGPEELGALVRCCQGAHDAALAYGLPFISGKDSLNNQFTQSAEEARRCGLPQSISIPGTLLISAISVTADVQRCVTADLKCPGNRVILLALPDNHCSLDAALGVHRQVAQAIRDGRVFAAHDVSDGGLAVALAEMCIAGQLGLRVDLGGLDPSRLSAEPDLAGYVLEVAPDDDWPGPIILGEVTTDPRLMVRSGARSLLDLSVDALQDAWRASLTDGPGGLSGG